MKLTVDNLFIAIEKKENNDVKQFFLNNHIDVADEYGRTALLNAAFYDNYELIRWLLDNGANINFQDNAGYTALHFAAQEAHLASVKTLLNNKANSNIQDIHGNTPSWVAIMNWKSGSNLPVLQELFKHGANLEIKNNAGKTAKEIIPKTIMEKLVNP